MYQQAIEKYLKQHGHSSIDLKAVLFDMDGVLFNSMPNHASSWHKVMERMGFGLSEEEAYMHEGRTGADTINIISRRERGCDATDEEIKAIYAAKSGKVTVTSYQAGGAGYYVSINHGDGFSSIYMHLNSYIVSPGQYVNAGQVIGYVGSTGLSSGPHLDFRVYMNGQAIDPLKMESPPSVPLKECHRDSFMLIKDSLIQCISKIS